MNDVLFALWFFLPAGLANAIPPVVARIPVLRKLDTPLDFSIQLRGRPLFGKNKTWRGLLAGIFVATAVVALQRFLYANIPWIQSVIPVDYTAGWVWWLGPLLGAGALLGDAIESMIKRQLGKKPGDTWFPYDQIDYIIGGLIASSFVVTLSYAQIFWVMLLWFGLHLVGSSTGFILGFKDKPI